MKNLIEYKIKVKTVNNNIKSFLSKLSRKEKLKKLLCVIKFLKLLYKSASTIMLTIGIKMPILKISKRELNNINKVRKKILSIPVSLIISNNFFKLKNIQLFFFNRSTILKRINN